jgi:hypothetical protein
MTQYNPMTELDLRLKTASIPIGRLHYHKAKHRETKVHRRTGHDFSGSQLPVIRKRVPEKYLGSDNLCDYRAPEKTFACGTVHCRPFSTIKNGRTSPSQAESSDNPYGPDNLSEDYWSPRFSCDLFRSAKTANASTRIDITIPNISFIRFQGDAPIQSADCMRRLWASMPQSPSSPEKMRQSSRKS